MSAAERAARGATLLREAGYAVAIGVAHDRPYLEVSASPDGPLAYRERAVSVTIQYPPADPVRPTVVLDGAVLPRHQNVNSGELCVMDNGADAWDADVHDEIFLIEQAARLLRDTEAGPRAVRDGEIDAPEPTAPQLPYHANSRAFLPDFGAAGDVGRFRGFISPPGNQPPTFVLTALDGVALPDMERLAKMLGASVRCDGECRTVREPVDVVALRTEDDVAAWIGRVFGDGYRPFYMLDQRFRRAKQPSLAQAAIVVHPDEAIARGRTQASAAVWIDAMPDHKTTERRLYAPQVLPKDGDFVRMPGCEPLSGKHVAVIGCGSVGSAVAEALARVGVGKFTLVDPDVLNLDNLVRHACTISGVGFGKAVALAYHLLLVSPRVAFNAFGERFGGITDPRKATQYDAVVDALRDADLIVCATGATEISAAVSLAVPDKTVVHAWIGPGAAGGRILKETSDGACFECFRFHAPDLEPLPDNGEELIYPTGCGFPTFTGRMHDIELVAQWAAKVSVATMVGGTGWVNDDNAFLVDNNQGTVSHRRLEPHPSCSRHRTRARQPVAS